MTNFPEIVKQICETLRTYAHNDPQRVAACKTGEEFEKCVVAATEETLCALGIHADIHYTEGSHVFPDIVLTFPTGEKYGIEVKSSSSASSKHWKINGNSVLGSTKEDVIDTYIVFGKTALGNQNFRFKRYEDAVANVAVTHSPRYFIDLDIEPKDTFFSKSGLTYREISEAPEPIRLITDYFKAQGQRAWWLAESTPAAIRMFSDLSDCEKAALIGYCFAHFPEIFSRSPKKYSRSAMWLVTDRSVVSASLRDNFSAGGKIDIVLSTAKYTMIPRIFETLKNYRESILCALDEASAEELKEIWEVPWSVGESLSDKIAAWIAISATMLKSKDINGYNPTQLLHDALLS